MAPTGYVVAADLGKGALEPARSSGSKREVLWSTTRCGSCLRSWRVPAQDRADHVGGLVGGQVG
jgi:hypothetical protein